MVLTCFPSKWSHMCHYTTIIGRDFLQYFCLHSRWHIFAEHRSFLPPLKELAGTESAGKDRKTSQEVDTKWSFFRIPTEGAPRERYDRKLAFTKQIWGNSLDLSNKQLGLLCGCKCWVSWFINRVTVGLISWICPWWLQQSQQTQKKRCSFSLKQWSSLEIGNGIH